MTAGDRTAGGDERRARRVFLGVVGGYALGVVLLAAFGLFGFIWKTVVVPALFIAAALLGRLRVFVRDWAVFLGAILLFDSLRGLIFALINRFELPVYMVYAIDWEREIIGGETLPEKLQRTLLDADRIGPLAKFLVVVHTSHFLFFLFFGLLIWMVRARDFGRFKLALVLLMYTGLLGYLAVPTVPPWMAANIFEVISPIRHVTSQLYNLNIPTLQASFDTNPIAAMPSLHSAFPSLLAMIALHHFGWRGWPMPLYAGLVFLAVTCLGEHYLVDVLAGVALAAGCYWAAYRSVALPRLFGAVSSPDRRPDRGLSVFRDPPLRTRILVMALLLILAEATGLWARKFHWHYQPTMAFIERELDGRSRLADFLRGRRAFRQGDFVSAQAAMTAAVSVTRPAEALLAFQLLARSAFNNEDWPVVIDSLGRFPLPVLGAPAAVMLAQAQLKEGLREDAFRTLDALAAVFPDDPGVEYWKSRLEAEHERSR